MSEFVSPTRSPVFTLASSGHVPGLMMIFTSSLCRGIKRFKIRLLRITFEIQYLNYIHFSALYGGAWHGCLLRVIVLLLQGLSRLSCELYEFVL